MNDQHTMMDDRKDRTMVLYEVHNEEAEPNGWPWCRYEYIISIKMKENDYSEAYKAVESYRNKGHNIRVQWELPTQIGHLDSMDEPCPHFQ